MISHNIYYFCMKIKDNISDEFDAFSINYTDDMIGCVPHYINLLSCFTEELPKKFNPTHILDLGCGNGNVTHRLSHSFPEASFTLLDASQEMLSLCEKRYKNLNAIYIESYFQEFEFKQDAYDMVVAGFSLHHCDSKEKKELFQKIYKSLTKGGVFSSADLMISKSHPEHSKLVQEWKLFVNTNFPDGEKWKWIMDHYDEFDRPDHIDDQTMWLQDVGFNDINSISYEKYWTYFRAIKK